MVLGTGLRRLRDKGKMVREQEKLEDKLAEIIRTVVFTGFRSSKYLITYVKKQSS